MGKKPVCLTVLVIVLMGVLGASFNVHKVEAQLGTIYIRADGSIDPSTANITSSDNVTYTFIDNIKGSIVVQRSDIVIDGDGWTLDGLNFTIWEGLNLTGVSNVTITDINIERFASYSIYLESASQCVISDNNVTGSEGGIGLFFSTGNTVSNNLITGCSEAVEIVSSSGNAVSGNNITNNNSGVYLVLSSTDNTVVGNNITFNEGNIILGNSSHNTITGNTITDGTEAIQLYASSNNTISGNSISSNYNGVWSRFDSAENVVSGNNITGNVQNGIWLDHSSDSTISENNISKNNYAGVFLLYSSNITVSGNNITGNSEKGNGIYLHYSSDNAILKNMDFSGSATGVLLWGSHRNNVSENILSPSDLGIVMGYSDDNRILNNTISHTETSGIQIQQICGNSIIANNIFSENSLYGIYIESENEETRYNAIVGNNIMHSLVGIHITRLSGNVIYHNNFVDNTNQTSVSNSTNIWDDGVEGNYWSDYEEKYPNATEIDGSGIWDTPYVIDPYNQDNYPFMTSWAWDEAPPSITDISQNPTIPDNLETVTITAVVTDTESGVHNVTLSYSTDGGENWTNVTMQKTTGDTYQGEIPGLQAGTHVQYKIMAYDNIDNSAVEDNAGEYYVYTVIPEFPSFLILPLFMIVTLVTVFYAKKRKKT